LAGAGFGKNGRILDLPEPESGVTVESGATLVLRLSQVNGVADFANHKQYPFSV